MEVGVFYLTPPIRFSNIIHLISKIPVLLQKKKRFDMIKYNPKFSIKKNAEINGCTESAIRKFIHKNSIDRRFDRKVALIIELRKIYTNGMSAYSLAQKSKRSINTINKYWEYITSEKELSDFNTKKEQKVKVSQPNEYYATHPSVTMDLLKVESFHHYVLEPACGGGFISQPLMDNGYDVLSTDLIDRGFGNGNIDFLTSEFEKGKYDIVTNPPYSLFIPFLLKAIDICHNKVAMLLPITFLSCKQRYKIYENHPPHTVYVYTDRICIAQNGKFEKYSTTTNPQIYAWFVWQKGFSGNPTIRWIHNEQKQ